jgi:hypothetical protein
LTFCEPLAPIELID